MEQLNNKLTVLERIYKETDKGKDYIYPSIVKMIAANLNIPNSDIDNLINECVQSGYLKTFENITGNQCIQITPSGIDYVKANIQ